MSGQVRSLQHSEGDLSLLQGFLSSGGDERSSDAVAWQYSLTPDGTLMADVIEADQGSPALAGALYAVVPVAATVDGRQCRIAQSLDTMTDVRHRGRGYFVELARRTYSRAHIDGVQAVYGFPNGNSFQGFVKHLAWTMLDPVPFLVRPLRTGYALKSVLGERAGGLDFRLPVGRLPRKPGWELRHLDRFGVEHEAMWRDAQEAGIRVAVDRSAAYLNWRFVDKPGVRYHRLSLTASGRCVGYVVWRSTDKHGGRIGYVMELVHGVGHRDAGRILLRSALRGMSADGCDLALAWCLDHSFNRGTYRRERFVVLPEDRRPIELHFGVLPLNDEVASAVRNRAGWYLSYADSDTV